MNIWRLVAHHEYALEALEEMKDRNRIAIGWSQTGDLRHHSTTNASEIASLIAQAYPSLNNANLGGPSLWNLYNEMQAGDLAIISANGKRACVFEISGPYLFENKNLQIFGYGHQRPANLTEINPNELWKECESRQSPGQNIRWTLFKCYKPTVVHPKLFEEGLRYDITSTAIERNPRARQKCLDHYGPTCYVCKFNFSKKYGQIGENYIHVHHRTDLYTQSSQYIIDPIVDLIPLCPNCHAMVHTRRPSMPVEELAEIYDKLNRLTNNSL